MPRRDRTPEEREERRDKRRSGFRLAGRVIVGAVRVGLRFTEAIATIVGARRRNSPEDR